MFLIFISRMSNNVSSRINVVTYTYDKILFVYSINKLKKKKLEFNLLIGVYFSYFF